MTNSTFLIHPNFFPSYSGCSLPNQRAVHFYAKTLHEIPLLHIFPTLYMIAVQNTPPHATRLHPSKARTTNNHISKNHRETLRRLLRRSRDHIQDTEDLDNRYKKTCASMKQRPWTAKLAMIYPCTSDFQIITITKP